MKSSWIIVLCVAFLSTVGLARPLVAMPQDAPAPADETAAAREEEAAEGEAKKGIEIGVYVEVGYGSSDMDALDTSTRTSSAQASRSSLTFDELDYSRAAIGWRLPGPKGSFRLVWQGYNETGYEFTSVGRDRVLGQSVVGSPAIVEDLDWWHVSAVDGAVTTTRTPPIWDFSDDTNMDGRVQRDEVRYPSINFSNTLMIEPNLQNRVQTTDVLYGRDFGPRRVEGRWWGGLRYFVYEGTLLQGAYLGSAGRGLGYTDGAFLRFLHAAQNATGVGPTGSLGLNVNFFDKRVQLFLNGQFGFLISTIETDTGAFFTIVPQQDLGSYQTASARLMSDRSRTSWQTHYDAGIRLSLKSGLILEAAYYSDGFLDAVLTPTELRVPSTPQEIAQGTSAVYATQDLVLDGWRASLAFQF